MYFSNAFRKDFVGFGSVRTTGATENLTAGQLGLFAYDTFNALPVVTSNAKPNKMFIIAQGSMHGQDTRGGISHGGLQESVKSRPINPKYIEKFYKVEPSRPVSDVWTIGYNGVQTCDPIAGECGSKYTIRVDVRGEAALRSYNRNLYRYFSVTTPCCDDCDVTCTPATADPYLIGKSLVEQINNDVEIGKFVRAELILETPISDANEVTFVKYTLSVLDGGNPQDLADVQNAYSSYTVTRIGRSGILSTYELIKTSGLPSAFTPTAKRLGADLCGSCPVGWTIGSALTLTVSRQVETDMNSDDDIDISFEDQLAVLVAGQGSAGSIAKQYKDAILDLLDSDDADILTADLTVTVNSYTTSNGVVTVELLITLADATPSATTFTRTLTDIVDGDVTTIALIVAKVVTDEATVFIADEYTAGDVETICVPPAGTSTAWVAGDSVYKTFRSLCATFPKDCGSGTSQEPAIDAFFANDPTIVASSVTVDTDDTCAEIVTLNQYSDNYYEIGCDEKPIPVYPDAPSYNGTVFEVCDCGVVTSPYVSGAVGIRLTAAYEDTKFGNCSFDPRDFYGKSPLKLEVSKIDDAELCTDQHTKWSVTHLTNAKAPSGLGETVLRDYMLSMNYKGEGFNVDPRWREVMGQEHLNIIDRNAYYKTYFLVHSIPNSQLRGMNVTNYDEKYLLAFHFAEDVDTTAFENLLAGYAALNDVELETY